MHGYAVNGNIDPKRVNMRPLVLSLREKNWNARIVSDGYDSRDDEDYSYEKQLKSKYGTSWDIFATTDKSVDLDSFGKREIYRDHNKLGVSITTINYESGDGYGQWIYGNHGDEERVEEYRNSTARQIYEVLEECRYFFQIEIFDSNNSEYTTQDIELCKDVATCLANMVGNSICKCADDGWDIYSTYTLIYRPETLSESAVKTLCKYFSINANELLALAPKDILEKLISCKPNLIYCYDPECIENSGIYTDILEKHFIQCGLSKKISNIGDAYNVDCAEVKVDFIFKGSKVEWIFNQDGDWVEHEFYVNLSKVIKENTKGVLAYFEMDDQSINSIFLEKDIAQYLCAKGVLNRWV
jgi:hypothetical protein